MPDVSAAEIRREYGLDKQQWREVLDGTGQDPVRSSYTEPEQLELRAAIKLKYTLLCIDRGWRFVNTSDQMSTDNWDCQNITGRQYPNKTFSDFLNRINSHEIDPPEVQSLERKSSLPPPPDIESQSVEAPQSVQPEFRDHWVFEPQPERVIPHQAYLAPLSRAICSEFVTKDWAQMAFDPRLADFVVDSNKLLNSFVNQSSDYHDLVYSFVKLCLEADHLEVLTRNPKIWPWLQVFEKSLAEFHLSKDEEGPAVVIREIGRGGFGIVEEIQLASGAVVARKTFNSVVLGPEERVRAEARFKREVTFQQGLNYRSQKAFKRPIAMPVLRSEFQESLRFTMPLASYDLRAHIRDLKYDNIGRSYLLLANDVFEEVLGCVQALHSFNYAHRDLKPENILFWDQQWVLADFGLCVDFGGTRITTTGNGAGTFGYQSPEQYTSAKDVDHRTDIYALGCILHDIYSGKSRLPFAKCSAKGAIGSVVERCTETDPDDRYPTTAELRADYRRAMREMLASPF